MLDTVRLLVIDVKMCIEYGSHVDTNPKSIFRSKMSADPIPTAKNFLRYTPAQNLSTNAITHDRGCTFEL